jgi:hypothetical protein
MNFCPIFPIEISYGPSFSKIENKISHLKSLILFSASREKTLMPIGQPYRFD